MVNTNTQWLSMSDRAIIEKLGAFIKNERLSQNKTQTEIARHAGINRWTIVQAEKGEPVNLMSLVQILRALNRLDVFNNFKFEKQISPLALAKAEKEQRQRARNKDAHDNNGSDW